jgi:hypothetical protein
MMMYHATPRKKEIHISKKYTFHQAFGKIKLYHNRKKLLIRKLFHQKLFEFKFDKKKCFKLSNIFEEFPINLK